MADKFELQAVQTSAMNLFASFVWVSFVPMPLEIHAGQPLHAPGTRGTYSMVLYVRRWHRESPLCAQNVRMYFFLRACLLKFANDT